MLARYSAEYQQMRMDVPEADRSATIDWQRVTIHVAHDIEEIKLEVQQILRGARQSGSVTAGISRLASIIVGLGLSLLASAWTPSFAARVHKVGFEELHIPNGAEPALTIGVWYPANAPATVAESGTAVATGAPVSGRKLALVVLSHGGAGSYAAHSDTALALARAGFVVAAVSHAGDTFDDQSQVLRVWRRPAQLQRLLSYMLQDWSEHDHLDDSRIGAWGFSNGGFTVLVAAGGRPDLSRIVPYCQAHPTHDLCEGLRQVHVDPAKLEDAPSDAWMPDPRIKAVVVVAPAFGFTFGRAGLSGVHVPVQLWGGADDRHQPTPFYEEAVRKDLPQAPEYHVVARAGHFDFLQPCNAQLAAAAPQICASAPGFNRAAFHQKFNAQVVRFFQEKLK